MLSTSLQCLHVLHLLYVKWLSKFQASIHAKSPRCASVISPQLYQTAHSDHNNKHWWSKICYCSVQPPCTALQTFCLCYNCAQWCTCKRQQKGIPSGKHPLWRHKHLLGRNVMMSGRRRKRSQGIPSWSNKFAQAGRNSRCCLSLYKFYPF